MLQEPGLLAEQELAVCCETDPPKTGGFASLMPEDAAYAVGVCREQDSLVSCRVQLRLEPEHPGSTPTPLRPTTTDRQEAGWSLTTKTPRHEEASERLRPTTTRRFDIPARET